MPERFFRSIMQWVIRRHFRCVEFLLIDRLGNGTACPIKLKGLSHRRAHGSVGAELRLGHASDELDDKSHMMILRECNVSTRRSCERGGAPVWKVVRTEMIILSLDKLNNCLQS